MLPRSGHWRHGSRRVLGGEAAHDSGGAADCWPRGTAAGPERGYPARGTYLLTLCVCVCECECV